MADTKLDAQKLVAHLLETPEDIGTFHEKPQLVLEKLEIADMSAKIVAQVQGAIGVGVSAIKLDTDGRHTNVNVPGGGHIDRWDPYRAKDKSVLDFRLDLVDQLVAAFDIRDTVTVSPVLSAVNVKTADAAAVNPPLVKGK